jgi:predicted alpha-1,2-mannosidase
VQLSPDTSGPQEAWYDWDHSAGYHYRDNVINGFTHTHVQGTGAPELGDVLLMPEVGGLNWAWDQGTPGEGYCSRFSHEREEVRAAYYSVFLETPRAKAELTATTRCGMHRYTYPAISGGMPRPYGVFLDLVHGLGSRVYHAELNLESPTAISGCRYTHGWAADRQAYFVIEFSQPVSDLVELRVDGKAAAVGARQVSGTEIKARFTFRLGDSSPAGHLLLVRVGISATGVEGARKNLAKEIPHWDFEAIRHSTETQWEQALSVLEATLPDEALTQAFYTGAYHGLTTPVTFNDVDGSYRGQDRQNHTYAGFTKYTTLSIWDIYRGEFPFLALVQPRLVNDWINTLIVDYLELNQHSLPMWPLWGNETWSMTGFHVAGMILGAYTRGLRSYDAEAAYSAMRDTAMEGATANDNRALQQQFRDYGYVPTGPHKESVSHTLDFAYDYWCVGAMAELLGKQEDAAYFYKLGQNYRNLFDANTGFMRGKTAEGKWREPFRPDEEYTDDYTESDAWQATFNVVQDVQGLIELYGGDEAFIAKLDALFAAPTLVYHAPPDITGLIGQDAQGNEPSNHIPYLYAFAGAAWKTQYWVRQVMARWYTNTAEGIPGNDDCGQLSSWFVLGALGFYPVNAATGVYVIASPAVRRAKIHNPERGTTFTIVAEDNSPENVYIQDGQLNGKTHARSWLTHTHLAADGELVLRMGPKPNKEWGAAIGDRPPSGLVDGNGKPTSAKKC